jgi:phosphinothricin acetyltransferase
MNPIVVRPSTEADLSVIAHIYGHYVLHSLATFETTPPSQDELARRRRDILALGLPYLIAMRGDETIGYAYASAYRPRPAYRFTVEDSIYVDSKHVGEGCGTLLLTALIEQCERGPSRQMIAVIGDSHNDASLRLHRRLAFREVGILRSVGFKFDRWVDTVLMQRELGAGTV